LRAKKTVLALDIAIVRKERLTDSKRMSGFVALVPDLVIEILSPSERVGRVNGKVSLYGKAVVQLIWIVDPGHQTVTEHAATQRVRLLQSDDSLTAENLFPGLQFQVDQILE
jgi:Uma2 family endonuclease